MRIAIDISQIIYQGTGVANYTKKLVESLLEIDKENEYVLFFSSLRRKFPIFIRQLADQIPNKSQFSSANWRTKFQIKTFKIPPILLEFLWNRLHICPIEWFIGKVDVFLSSDWLQPPTLHAKKVTTIHDLIPFKYPQTLHSQIVAVHQRRMKWVKKECDLIICDSESTKKDVMEILGIEEKRLKVIYPGVSFQPPGLNSFKPKDLIRILKKKD